MIISEQEHSDQQKKNNPAMPRVKKPAKASKKPGSPNAAMLNQLVNDFNHGLLAEAKELAIQLTQAFPKHGMAWKVLGVICHHEQDMEKASEALGTAAVLMPKDAEVHYNLANFYCDTGQLEVAKTSYQKAIKLAPDFAKAHFNLAHVFKDLKQHALAETSYKRGLKLEPQHAQIHFHLGQCLNKQNRFKEGLKSFQKSLQLGINDVDLYLHLVLNHRALGDLEQAEQSCREALKIYGQHADVHNHLAIILSEQGHLPDAEAAYLKAIDLDPDHATAHHNLGLLYRDMKKPKEAEACYRNALSIQPENVKILNSMAALLFGEYRYTEAETYCREALALDSTFSYAWSNLGLIFQAKKLGEESQKAFEEALLLQPDDPSILSNYGVTLRMVGKSSEAEAVLKKAIGLNNVHASAYMNLGGVYLDQGQVEIAIETIKQALVLAPDHLAVYSNILYSTTCSERYCPRSHLEFAYEYGRIVSQQTDQKFDTWLVNSKDKRLRVGVVSGDLRQHPVAYFLKNVIQHIDSSKILLVAYLTDGRMDNVSDELRPFFAEWKSLAGHNDQSAAKMIHADGVHVLLDLSGHTAGNRLPIFAWQPAPVQATWLGYWSTTGVAEIDYCLTDEISLPSSCQTQFTEKIKYLPNTRLCFSEPEIAAEVTPLPAVKNGFVTFGCYQQLAKVGDAVMQLWSRVMQAIPNARLRWQCRFFIDENIITDVKKRLQNHGIDTGRITLLGQQAREAYFASYAEVDINLDSFPFTGGTTTCDALWMGVPTLTLIGDTMIARQGASLMTAAGLPDWVAANEEEYLEKAISFSTNLAELVALRSNLRARLKKSPLLDGTRFARHFETALQEMWQEKCTILAKKFVEDTQSSTHAQNPTQNRNHQNVATAIEIVSATRMSEQDFWQQSALGQSLVRHLAQGAKFKINVAYENALGLSEVFNAAIAGAEDDDALVFIHDDVWLDEADLSQAILSGLEKFDVVGVAGNKRRLPRQPAWAFTDTQFTWDTKDNLSGKVAHGQSAYGKVSEYGDVPTECELLDGVFLAVRKQTLVARQITFDPQFDFHFYDLDFCRSCRNAGLRLGTWPIQLTHQSGGAFGSPVWLEKYRQYLVKWDEAIDLDSLYQQAFTYEQQGEIVEAARLYHTVLQHQPQHPEANHRLGFIEVYTLGAETSLPRFETAVMARPDIEQFWVSYIDALMMAGKTDHAISAIEIGQQHGLSSETVRLLTTEYAAQPDAPPPEISKTVNDSQEVLVTLIPAYKHAYIPQLLVSLASQTYLPSKVILSDDSPNGEVSKVIADPALKAIVDKLNIIIIQGPMQGTMSNIVYLLEYWQRSSQLVHILFDDDILYPSFYEQHVNIHTGRDVGVSISYRWFTSESGQPCMVNQVPEFIKSSGNLIEYVNTEQMFSSVVPNCDNWLGEFSNAVFDSSVIHLYQRSRMLDIPYYGLGDIGLFLEISLQAKVAVIKNYLGGFRQNNQQNSASQHSILFKCGTIAWVAIASAAFKLGRIDIQQFQHTVQKIQRIVNTRFQKSADMQGFHHLFSQHAAGSVEFEKTFLSLWQKFMACNDWLHAQKIGQLV